MKAKILIFAGLFAFSRIASATVTLSFNNGATGISSGFANAGGVASNNMSYGIVVDGGGNGFGFEYPALDLDNLSGSYVLTTFGGLADDVLYVGEFRTGDTSIYDDVQTGGPGGMFTVSDVAFQGLVGTNDVFRVVWFGGAVDSFGVPTSGALSDSSFVLPSDGFSVDYTAPFVGTDPIRTAGLSYSGTSGTPLGFGLRFGSGPEPSSALLAVVGALGFLRRHRA